MPSALFHARNGAFAICIALSFGALGLSAYWTAGTRPFFVDFEGVELVTSSLSIIILSVLLTVGFVRKNAMVTIIGIELPSLVVLSALYLAGGVIINGDLKRIAPFGCNDIFLFNAIEMTYCNRLVSLKGISFATFAIMTAYWLPLLIMVIIEYTQGRNTLTLSIRDVSFSSNTQQQANILANGIMGEVGLKDPDNHSNQNLQLAQQKQQEQQMQIQLQQLQLQQLQQQQAILQQQYSQQGKQEV